MKSREDDNIRALVKRYEQQRSNGLSQYFDVDEFDRIADYYLDRGRTNKLSEVVSSALRIHPNSTVIHLKRAILYVETGEPMKALQLLDRLPEQEEAGFVRAAAFLKLKRKEEGLALLQDMVIREQYDKDLACLEAVNVLNAENLYKEALDFVRLGLEHNPENTDLMSEGAFCAEQLNDMPASEHYYRMLLEVDVYSYENWFNLGQILFSQERFEEACKAYDFALVSNPGFMPAVLQMGHACFQMEHYEDAAKFYLDYLLAAIEESLPSAEGNSIDDLMVFVGEAFEKAEHYESAIEWYEHALTTNPELLIQKEVDKKRRKYIERLRQQRGLRESPGTEPAYTPAEPLQQPIPAQADTQKKGSTPFSPYDEHERNLMRMIVRYGEQQINLDKNLYPENFRPTVLEFISMDLENEEIEFQHPVYKLMYKEALAHHKEPHFVAERFFLNHHRAEISLMAGELISEEYELSKIHSRFQVVVEEKDKLHYLVPQFLEELKWKIVKEELAELRSKIKTAEQNKDESTLRYLLEEIKILQDLDKELAKSLGERIITP
jgi:tetratricopeptide (TPR) repeat protein